MIRRLILYQPMTEDEARAATAWAAKLGEASLMLSYFPSPVPMRILMFDRVNLPGKIRRAKERLLLNVLESDAPSVAALRASMFSGRVVFNVMTGHENGADAYPETDAVFTIAFPTGEAVAWFKRVSGGIAPGIAASCSFPEAHRQDATFNLHNSIRYLFFKRRPREIKLHEAAVIAFARHLLSELPPF